VERPLALMCGAGPLPAHLAREAVRKGFRVVAFVFGDAPGVGQIASRTVVSSLADLHAVVAELRAEGVSAALFSGKFWKQDLLSTTDTARTEILAHTGGALTDAGLGEAVVSALAALGIEVLDQLLFLGDWLAQPGRLGRVGLGPAQEPDVERGFAIARRLAELGIGQTVVLKHGMVAAVEAAEGTTEAIRRGLQHAGPGAVVVKAVARDNDYRFDVPSIGPDTLDAMVAGGASALAIEAGRVAVLDLPRTVALADQAGVALVGVDASRPDR
jgi:DUF1009 family protein